MVIAHAGQQDSGVVSNIQLACIQLYNWVVYYLRPLQGLMVLADTLANKD